MSLFASSCKLGQRLCVTARLAWLMQLQGRRPLSVVPDSLLSQMRSPKQTDVVIIGGGAVGSSVAYWLKSTVLDGLSCTVIERDPTYSRSSTTLSNGNIRQQYSIPENTLMSLFSVDFLRNIDQYLTVTGGEPADVQFYPMGYLFLAKEEGAKALEKKYETMTKYGAKVQFMTALELKEKFPWLSLEGITCGTYGLDNEGGFDPWLLLTSLKKKAMALGADYIKGDVVGFHIEDARSLGYTGNALTQRRLDRVQVRGHDGHVTPLHFDMCINCAGPWAGKVAQLAGVGLGEGVLSYPLPIEPRKRYVFHVHCPIGPVGQDTPFLIDTDGVYFRKEGIGQHYLCGVSQEPNEYSESSTLEVDYEFFNTRVWPSLAARVPAFQTLKVKSAWAAYYDYNFFDQNLVIGQHPYFTNLIFANGSSGHGIQHAPAIGRAVMELILYGEYRTINLDRLSFNRILNKQPVFEENIF